MTWTIKWSTKPRVFNHPFWILANVVSLLWYFLFNKILMPCLRHVRHFSVCFANTSYLCQNHFFTWCWNYLLFERQLQQKSSLQPLCHIKNKTGSKLTLICICSQCQAWGSILPKWLFSLRRKKSVFAKSQECSFQKVHNFLKWRLTNETPKVLLKSCLDLRWLGFPRMLLVGMCFSQGWRNLEEEG